MQKKNNGWGIIIYYNKKILSLNLKLPFESASAGNTKNIFL